MREKLQRDSVRFTSALTNLTLILSLLAALIFRLTDGDGRVAAIEIYGWFLFETALVVVGCWYLQRVARCIDGELVLSPLLLFVAVVSILAEPLSRRLFEAGRPFEFAIMFALKNTMLAMGAVAFVKRYRLLASIASLFLVTFCGALARGTLVPVLVAAYVLGGILWLSLNNWETIRDRLLSHSVERRFPWRLVAFGAIAVCLTLATMEVSTGTLTRVSRGFFPGSGGSESSDPYSRDGVGDGDMLVAGQDNITSFAPLEDAPFRTDDEPSLYDVFDDTYDEPVQNKEQDRAIPLPPKMSKELQQRLANSNRASREFSTLRQSDSRRRSQVPNLHTDALLFVSGRIPLHLRMETYDLFDGIHWYPETPGKRRQNVSLKFETIDGLPWLRTGRLSASENFRQTVEPHAIKVATIDTNVIPAPLNLLGLHIDRVEQPSMFGWHRDSILKMNRRRLPEAVTIRLSSGLVDPDSIGADHSALGSSGSSHRAVPTVWHMGQVRKLAREWTRDVEPGWNRVQTVVERLRTEYQHDRAARPPEDCVFPVGEFLLKSGRGEDYQFATAAALMLRSLGYSTRLVSGFYASPEKYDPRTRLTPVHAEDVHVWAEIYLGNGVWQTIEATPGYDVLEPLPGVMERILAAVKTAFWWSIDHAAFLAGIVLGLAPAIFWRAELRDCWFQIRDRCFPPRTQREAVLRVARRLERRLSDCEFERPPGVTPINWIEQIGLHRTVSTDLWNEFSQLWERVLFSATDDRSAAGTETLRVCETIRQSLSLRTIRSLNGQPTIGERISDALKRNRLRSHPKSATAT